MSAITFTAYTRPIPQGSMKAFVISGKARLTSDNRKLKPFRAEVRTSASDAMAKMFGSAYAATSRTPLFAEKEPVALTLEYVFLRPPSAPKARTLPVVKPDLDKLIRATLDALTGVIYADDAQVVQVTARKVYGETECVKVIACEIV